MINEYICSDRTKDLFRIIFYNNNVYFRPVSKLSPSRPEISKKITEFCDELTNNPVDMKRTDQISVAKYVAEWSFYLGQLSINRDVNIDTVKMHIIANMHLKNFGVPTSSSNSKMNELLFYGSTFNKPRLFLAENTVYTKSNKHLYEKKGSPDHMEVLFARVEKELHKCISRHIPKDEFNTIKPISVAIQEQKSFVELKDDLLFKILLSTYIHICEIRYSKKGPNNYQCIEDEFSNVEKLNKVLLLMLRRNWIFAHAYDYYEISLPSRGLIRVPELDDAFFFSISRVWGIWIVSSFDSYSNLISPKKIGIDYIPDTVKSIRRAGGSFGRKWNMFLKNYPDDREYFYPYAMGLALRPEYKLSSLPIISNKHIKSTNKNYFEKTV